MVSAASASDLTAPLREALQSLSSSASSSASFFSSSSPAAATAAAIAVAVSGGADSAMLAVHVAPVARALGLPLHIFHVHHGLFAQADDWAERVRQLGQALDIPVRVVHVQVAADGGTGIEAAARYARYAALAQCAAETGVGHILLAHHRDDQAETVLLRLLRGAGLGGMAAMAARSERDGLTYLRPWLGVARSAILQAAGDYAAQTGWAAVQDPSNTDPRYTRAALRTLLAPVLDTRWPGWQAIVARHARLTAEAVQILDEVARDDFSALSPGEGARSFALAPWRLLSSSRQAHVLRHWLSLHGARMPSEARLAELLKQLRQLHSLGHDRQMLWEHGPHRVRCVRGRVEIEVREHGRQ